jgi:hypothetical protein
LGGRGAKPSNLKIIQRSVYTAAQARERDLGGGRSVGKFTPNGTSHFLPDLYQLFDTVKARIAFFPTYVAPIHLI